MAGDVREVRVRLSVVGGPGFRQQLQGAAQSLGTLGRTKGGVDAAGNSVVGFIKKAGAVAGVGLAVKSTVRNFGDFQQSLNQLQATGGATAAQMQQVQTRARELGKAVAGMSSTDAAQAMLELAKGGLSVDQSMQAATGTLNLAAAAQINAADAAGIQASALNTFRLGADQADKVADILANTANAASGEITDFAQGLAQAGTPAAQLGISIGDTSTALGLFAKNGILGSDAGTSLKSMLIALLSPSKEQAKALEQLGVNAFDANGNFVGLEAISGQLADAQSRLTTESFNAAAATAFGTDAVRAAGTFATAGAQGFADLATQVNQAGGAQKMATANTEGLKGALDRVKASLEDAQLQIGEKLAPQTEELTNKIAELIPQLIDKLEPALVGIGDAAVASFDVFGTAVSSASTVLNPLIQGVAGVTQVFAALPSPLQTVLLALGAVVLMRSRLAGVWTSLRTGASNVVTPLRIAGLEIARATRGGAGPFRAVGAGLRYVGVSAAAAGRSLSAAFGGPIGIALIGVTTALSFMGDASAEAEQHTDDLKASVSGLDDVLTRVSGKFDAVGKAQLAVKFSANEAQFRALGSSAAEAAEMVSRGGSELAAYRARIVQTGIAHAQFGIAMGKGLVGPLADVNVLLDDVAGQSQKTQSEMSTLAQTISTTLGGRVSADQLLGAFADAEANTRSVEDALASLKITGTDADLVIQQLGSAAITGGGGLHYFSQQAADNSQKQGELTTAVKGTVDAQAEAADAEAAAAAKKEAYKQATENAALAVERAQDAYDRAREALTPYEQATQQTKDAQSALAAQVDRVTDAINRQKGILPSVDDAQLRAKDSAASLREQFKLGTDDAIRLTDAFDKKTGRLKIDTAEQRDFVRSTIEMRENMVSVATATYQAEVKTKGHTVALRDAQLAAQGVRDDYKTTATAILGSGEAADKAAESIGANSQTVAQQIASDTAQNVRKMDDQNKAAQRLADKKVEQRITANKDQWEATVQSVAVFPMPGKNIPVSAELAPFYAALARIKAEPQTVYVNVQGKWVGTTGGPGRIGSPAGMAYTGGLIASLMPGFAAGGQPFTGVLPGTPPSNPTADNLLAQLEDGRLIRVRSREFVVNEQATKLNERALRWINSGGVIPGFASGGLPSAGALAGIAPRDIGDREGRVVAALDALRQALDDQRDTVRDSAAKTREAGGKLADAIAQQRRVATEQRQQVKDQQATNAARERKAQEALAAANKRTVKTAADQAAKTKAVEAAEKALSNARELNARQMGKQQRQEANANAAEQRKVDAARRAQQQAAGTEKSERARLRAVENNYRVEAELRQKQRALAKQYDDYVAAAAKTQERLAQLQQKDAELREQGKQSALGIGGGILGSSAFQGTSIRDTDVVKQLQGVVAGGKKWTDTIRAARKKGLSAEVLSELTKDPEGRGRMVLDAVAAGDVRNVKQINSLYSQAGRYGQDAGAQLSTALGITKGIRDDKNLLSAQEAVVTLTGAQLNSFSSQLAAAAVAGMRGISVTASFGAGPVREMVKTEMKLQAAKDAAKKYGAAVR